MKGIILAGGSGTRLFPLKIACIEEIAYLHGFISKEQATKAAVRYGKSGYGAYIQKVITH